MKHKLKCDTCGATFESSHKTAVSCSDTCRKERASKMYGFIGIKNNLPNNFVGKLHELKVVLDVAEKGYDVYYSVFPQQNYDLVVMKRGIGTLFKLEVKTGYRSNVTGNIVMPKHNHDKWDIMAIVIRASGEIVYFDKTGQLFNF